MTDEDIDAMVFSYDIDLLLRCYWEWKRSGFTKWPDPHEVANRNIAFSDDMMRIDRIMTTFEARVKRGLGQGAKKRGKQRMA